MASTAYNSYLHTSELHSLQDCLTSAEGERSFLVVCQVQELYFGLIGHDLEVAAAHLHGGEVTKATTTKRSPCCTSGVCRSRPRP
ncbi:hypothetical protein KO481_37540 [Nocardia sp. NEAU-G5]|uniref:Uncharacterized protein n=1 Tax=Nocardia albiluteola TaxID=2842303 RepID=A0ABS6BCL8_9NOCA|nr:hypothetical protein [Nocardia albiluteola]MBU3067211.1 hypothetical protein [Nocardia albiluteola]